MRMRFTFPAAVFTALLVAMSGVHAQQQFTIFASIVDGSGAPVVSIQPSDLRVKEHGSDASVVKVEPVDWPTKLQILVDNGVGIGSANFVNLRNGIYALIETLPPSIEVTLVTTAPQPRFLARGTADREAINKGLALLSYDTGAGRFVESLNEALQRIERDKSNFFPAIISVGTFSGDRTVLDRDVKGVMQRLEQHPTTVHVVLFNGGSGNSGAGANQTEVGLAVTKFTKGRFENINAATRMVSLLPELGALVAKSHERQRHQFRITVQRPAGATGPVAQVSLGADGGDIVSNLSFDGRIP
jgi:hypothetical protein